MGIELKLKVEMTITMTGDSNADTARAEIIIEGARPLVESIFKDLNKAYALEKLWVVPS